MMGALTGRRVLVTRALQQASALAAALEREGASVVVVPAIEIAPPFSYCGLDAALSALRSFDWVVFASANAVEATVNRLRRLGIMSEPKRVAAVGPSTARAVVELGLAATVDLAPERFVAEALVEALMPQVAGAAVLVVRAADTRQVLADGLRAVGAEVTEAIAYRTVMPVEAAQALRAALEGGLDAATFTSGSSVHHLALLLAELGCVLPDGVVTVSIGPITSQTMRDKGWRVDAEAREATLAALVEALAARFLGQI